MDQSADSVDETDVSMSDLDEMSDAESKFSDHDSITEQSEDDSDDEDDNNISPLKDDKNKKNLLGKDKTTKWLRDPPNQNVRIKRENIVIRLPGMKKCAKDAKVPLDCWNLFFPKETIERVVSYTNVFLESVRLSKKCKTEIQPTSVVELRAMIGLLYLIGVHKASRLNLKELWATDGSAPDCFRAVMSKTRFYNLLSALKFDDVNDRDDRKKLDNLAPIREFSEDFIKRCQDNYTPGAFLTIDEMLQAFRGRCKFRQYIANKPAKYGIKIYSMADSKKFYTYNMEIYCGKQPPGPFRNSNSALDVVNRL